MLVLKLQLKILWTFKNTFESAGVFLRFYLKKHDFFNKDPCIRIFCLTFFLVFFLTFSIHLEVLILELQFRDFGLSKIHLKVETNNLEKDLCTHSPAQKDP